jgi:nucleoside-diphosphate-sugar epimerase
MDTLTGKRLVIFGCGYVGTAVALHALERNVQVTALTRNAASAVVLREQGIETVSADLATDGWHAEIEGGADFVLNCVSAGGGGAEGYRHSYIEGMASILAWARRRGAAGTMVYTSSTSVYPQDGGVVVNESAATTPASERATLLLEAEQRLRNATGACARWFVLRLAGIYGPGRHHFIDQVRAGEASGRGEHRLNLIHREDIVSAIWACFTAPVDVANEIFNVADDAPARKIDVTEWLAAELKVLPPHFTGEPMAGRRTITPDRVISNTKLKRRLGWQPRYPSFREGCRGILKTASL